MPRNRPPQTPGFLDRVRRSLRERIAAREEVRGARRPPIGRAVRKFDLSRRDQLAQEKYGKQRKRGLNLNEMMNSTPFKIRSNAIRDSVTIKTLKINKDKNVISSQSLTYDREHGRVQIRPHKHKLTIEYTPGEQFNVKFSQAKRLKFTCDCEYWMYDCEYSMAMRWGASDLIYSNGQFPIQKNPKLAQNMCKHGYVLLNLIRQRKL